MSTLPSLLSLAVVLLAHAGSPAAAAADMRPAVPPRVVHRGEPVQLSARAGVVVAQVSAEALQDGGIGETIRVRNLQNGKVQQARVTAAGHVEVSP